MAITDSIKDILSVKIKPRYDNYSDQYTRIFMVKIMMISALLIGLNWSSDKINCIIPGSIGVKGGFVGSACWINGFYVFEKIRYHVDEVGYFGMPRDIQQDGMYPDGQLCSTKAAQANPNARCEPMEKTFFLQYQYMTFVMAALALLYYAPYAFFRWINQDMVSLKGSLKDAKADKIIQNYLNHRVNSSTRMRLRIIGNITVKILYIFANIAAFLILDSVLNEGFTTYGLMWTRWAKLDNEMAYDYMGMRHSPKPGNVLLPTFGFCEVHESAKDIKTSVLNRHKFVCEISQHVLYQYVFIVVWFAMVFGIGVAILGLLAKLLDHMIMVMCFLKGGAAGRRMYKSLTLRECEYLDFIRRKDTPLYNEIVKKLKEQYNYGMDADLHMEDMDHLKCKGPKDA